MNIIKECVQVNIQISLVEPGILLFPKEENYGTA